MSAKPTARGCSHRPAGRECPFREHASTFLVPVQHHIGTSQCGSSLAIPLRVSDEWHRHSRLLLHLYVPCRLNNTSTFQFPIIAGLHSHTQNPPCPPSAHKSQPTSSPHQPTTTQTTQTTTTRQLCHLTLQLHAPKQDRLCHRLKCRRAHHLVHRQQHRIKTSKESMVPHYAVSVNLFPHPVYPLDRARMQTRISATTLKSAPNLSHHLHLPSPKNPPYRNSSSARSAAERISRRLRARKSCKERNG